MLACSEGRYPGFPDTLFKSPPPVGFILRQLLAASFALLVVCAAADSNPSASLEDNWSSCVTALRQRAADSGISSATIALALDDVRPLQRVVAADRNQAEFTRTFADYLDTRVTTARIETGRKRLREHRTLLDEVAVEHGVPAQYLVAFWGLETNFGSFKGRQPTFSALATLACDARRSGFFANQVIDALHVVETDGLEPAALTGSWAGALGHMQFMPTTWRRYAVDGDGDGRRHLAASLADAMHSAGRFLAALGWERGWRWGREVRLPEAFDYSLTGRDNRRPLSEWRRLGVRRVDGAPLPDLDAPAAIIVPMGHRGPAFAVYGNFEVIMGWNRSEHYALTVGHLADRINGAGGFSRALPDDPRLTVEAVRSLQESLNALGYEAGRVDGIAGSGTRSAIMAFQVDRELIADGYPTTELVAAAIDAAQGLDGR